MSSPTPTQLTCHGMTDAGRVRSVNEDHFGLFPEGGVFVVADGVGGSENGALASRMVVEACQRAALAPGEAPASREDPLRIRSRLVRAELQKANADMRSTDWSNPARGSASTVAVLLLDPRTPGRALALHSGDSRVYHLRDGGMTLLTRDHIPESDRDWAMESGLDQEHRSNRITQAIGARDKAVIDATPIRLREGDLFMLCTDGLYKMVRESDVLALLKGQGFQAGPAAVRALLDAALNAGGRDNVTVALVRVDWAVPATAAGEDFPGDPETETSDPPSTSRPTPVTPAVPRGPSDSGSGDSSEHSHPHTLPKVISLNLSDTAEVRAKTDPMRMSAWRDARQALRRLLLRPRWEWIVVAVAVAVLALVLGNCSAWVTPDPPPPPPGHGH